jgi:hypothetical protein
LLQNPSQRDTNVGQRYEAAAPFKPVNGVTSMTTDIKHTTDKTASTHTPGPWEHDSRTEQGFTDYIVYSANEEFGERFRGQRVIVDTFNADYIFSPEGREANARLIAAAPKLLESLSYFVNFAALNDDNEDDDFSCQIAEARRLIAEAKGLAA